MTSPAAYFGEQKLSLQIFEVIQHAVESAGQAEITVSKSQISFRRHKSFAWVWRPGQYLKGKTAPLVITFSLPYRHSSPRWKQIVEPKPGHFTHHLELFSIEEVDDEVYGWIQAAWAAAG
jgi:hypothetical protein